MSWKKNQACCRATSRTALPLTTHCRASSSCSNCGQGEGHQGPCDTLPHPLARHDLGKVARSLVGGSEQQEAMQGGMRADSSPDWALDVGRSTGPSLWGSGIDIRSATLFSLYLLHSVSWLRGWRGRGGGLEVRGGTARAAVDGLGRMG